jgi:hypothetical protein
MLMGAAAGKLGTLDGIPASVKAELRGNTGINRVAVVNWALDNTFNTTDEPDKDNCTNFVSDALLAGGMLQSGTLLDRSDPNAWFKWSPLGINSKYTRSWTWDGAANLERFLLQNGSNEVPYSQAQPGDIAFYSNDGGIYHSAVVTAVVNGQVFYSQHTPGEQNASWASRQYVPATANPANPTSIIIVQPGLDDTMHPDPEPGPP